MKTTVKNYETIGDYLADLSRPDAGVSQNSQATGRREFFWTETFGDALELVRCGWADGTARVAQYRDSLGAWLSAAKSAKSREFAWDVAGDFVDVGRVLSGEPECFGSEAETGERTAGRVVSIRLNSCVSCAVSADTIAARGVAVLCAVDLLEACGTRVEVVVSVGSKGRDKSLLDGNVTVKRAGEQVDPDRLAFAVAHPSFFRRFGFRFLELYGHSPSTCRPCPLTDYGTRDGVVEIDEILSSVRLDAESLKAKILEVAQKCGLTFDDSQIADLAAGA